MSEPEKFSVADLLFRNNSALRKTNILLVQFVSGDWSDAPKDFSKFKQNVNDFLDRMADEDFEGLRASPRERAEFFDKIRDSPEALYNVMNKHVRTFDNFQTGISNACLEDRFCKDLQEQTPRILVAVALNALTDAGINEISEDQKQRIVEAAEHGLAGKDTCWCDDIQEAVTATIREQAEVSSQTVARGRH